MKDSNLHLLPSQRSTLELMEHISGNFPKGGLPTPIDCDLFSLVSAQNDQSYEPCRCFLIATHALSLLKGQDTENNPKWWTRRDSNALPPACKAGALPAELLAQISHFLSDMIKVICRRHLWNSSVTKPLPFYSDW